MSDFNIEAKAEKLCDIIMKKDEFWETKNKAILLLIDLVLPYENQPEEVLIEVFTAGFFRVLKEPVKVMICDLRSQQVRDITNLLSVISQICNDKMKGFLRDCFNNILDGIKVPNKVMSGYVDESIMLMIRNVTFKSAIPLIVTEAKDNKAKYVRERCLDYINEILINWDVNDREADNLCEAIRSGLEDAGVKSREIARSAYMNMFQRYPKKTEKIKNALTASSLKVKLSQSESELTMNTSTSTIDSGISSTAHSEKAHVAPVTRAAPTTVTKAPPTPHVKKSESVSHAPKTTEKAAAHKTQHSVANDHAHGHASHHNASLNSSTNSTSSSTTASSAQSASHNYHHVRESAVPASVANVSAFRQSIRRKSMVANPFESITSFTSSIEIDDDSEGSPAKHSPALSSGSNIGSPSKLGNHSTSPNKKASIGGYPTDSPTKRAPASAFSYPSSANVKAPTPDPMLADTYRVPRTENSLSSVNLNNALPKNVSLNMLVRVSRGKDVTVDGIVRFIGTTTFASGMWIGVELFSDAGKNNGSVQGQVYFECPANRGLFVKEENVEPIPNEPSTTKNHSTPVFSGHDTPPSRVSGGGAGCDTIGDEIRNALLTNSSFVKSTSHNSLPILSPTVMVQGHVSQVNEHNGLEKRNQLKCVLKLKVSQLLETLNGQMDIVKQLEEEDKNSTPFNIDRYRGIIDEVVDLTTQELELVHSFKNSLVTQQLY